LVYFIIANVEKMYPAPFPRIYKPQIEEQIVTSLFKIDAS